MAISTEHQRRTGKGNGYGIVLYALTLVAEFPGYLARAFVTIIPALLVFKILFNDNGFLGNGLAVIVGFYPLVWSVCGLIYPLGTGWWWRNRSGGREPSQRERRQVQDAFKPLAAKHPGLTLPNDWFVIDGQAIDAAVSGRTLKLSRGLLDSPWLECILAHELGHLHTLDGHLTAALNRLVVWPDPLGPTPPGQRSGIVRLILRGILWVADGGAGLFFLKPFWGRYWRDREYLADAYAAQLGAGEQLILALETEAMIYDRPVPFIWMTEHSHPPTELRIDRLRAARRSDG